MKTCTGGDGRPANSKGWCQAHWARIKKHGDPRLHIPLTALRSDRGKRRGPQNPALLDPEKRQCRDCRQVKPLSDFGPLKKGPLGKRYTCRACDAIKAKRERARYKLDPEQHERFREGQNRSRIKAAYGAPGLAAYERIKNGDGCDVCGTRTTTRRGMAIDHCHVNGHVRGILCKDCNLVLGWMNDDPKRLRALADYLDRQR